jgi:hypothetical protein
MRRKNAKPIEHCEAVEALGDVWMPRAKRLLSVGEGLELAASGVTGQWPRFSISTL